MSIALQALVVLAPVALMFLGLFICTGNLNAISRLSRTKRTYVELKRRSRIRSGIGITVGWIGILGFIPAIYFACNGTPVH